MAGILHYLDINHSATLRKLHLSHKRHNSDGLEAPRNSVEFALESSQNCRAVHDDISYSCNNHCSKPNFYPNGSSMRKLIEQEISIKPTENSKRQSVVARLMGMDPFPDPISSPLNSNQELRDKTPIQKRGLCELSKEYEWIKNPNQELRDKKPIQNRDSYELSRESEWIQNPKMREKERHPQEEELQRFKSQFEAWQASKLLQTSRSVELENFGKHKFVHSFSLQQKNRGKEKDKEREISLESRNSVDLPSENSYYEEEREKSVSPTCIVILKPCPEMIFNFNMEESKVSSPDIIKRENNMQKFLEEVKNKLKLEIEGKFQGNKTDPKQIARNIANQIRETVVQDINKNNHNNNKSVLTRSESARWYRAGTGESKDTRKLLSEKIKNVLKRETENPSAPLSSHKTARPTYDIKRKGIKVNSHIGEPHETEKVSSPRNLVRSFSAPVSGSGFVKLLTEELDLSSEAKLERKNGTEICEHERIKGRKEGLERNGKVRNLRQNLGLRKWLFGKRFQSVDERTMEGFMPVKSFVTTPSVVVNSGFIQENFTEVPPSPASVCNSPRGGYPSPISPLHASFIEERTSFFNITKEIMPVPADPSLSFISDQVDISMSRDSKTEENLTESEPIATEVEPHAKSYVKTLLITAGLYKSQPSNHLSPRWEILTKTIPKSVFEQVEEVFNPKNNLDDVALRDSEQVEEVFNPKNNLDDVAQTEPLACDCGAISASHEMLFDLTNEAIMPNVFGTSLSFKKWVVGPALHGKRLLDEVWRRVEKSTGVRQNRACSLDDLICDDLRENSWRGMFNEEMWEFGLEIEFELIEELIDELFWDVLINIGEFTR